MPTSFDDDLEWTLTLDPDVSRVDKAIDDIGKKLEQVGKKARADIAVHDKESKTKELDDWAKQFEKPDIAEKLGLKKILGGLPPELGKMLGGKGDQGIATLLGGVLGGQGGGGMLGQVGGMVGEAFGGPVGAVIGEYIAKAIPKYIAAPAQMVANAFGFVDKSLKSLQGTLGPIGLGFDLLSGGIKKFKDFLGPIGKELFGPMIDALAAIPEAIKGILGTMTMFAAKMSPAQFKMMSMAVEDFQATIGQAFLPIMQMMTKVIRDLGDIFANLLPNTSEVMDAIGPLSDAIDDMMDSFKDLAAEVGPLIRDVLISALRVLGNIAAGTARMITLLVQGLKFLLGPIMDLLGYTEEGRAPRHRQLAARPAHIGGVEEYQRQLQIAAFTQPGLAKAKEDMPKHVSRIAQIMENLDKWMANVFSKEGFIQMLIEASRSIGEGVAGAATGAAHEAAGAGGTSIAGGMAQGIIGGGGIEGAIAGGIRGSIDWLTKRRGG